MPFPVHGQNVSFKRQTVDNASQLRKMVGEAKIGTNATSLAQILQPSSN